MKSLEPTLSRILGGTPAKECETGTLEFKEDRGHRAELEETLVRAAIGFANAAGGTIVVGVADRDGGPQAFTGTDLSPDAIRSRIHGVTSPPLLVEAEILEKPARLLVLRVHRSATVHADSKGRVWRRVDDTTKPMTPDEVARLANERRGYDWSAEPSGRPCADALPEALETARRLLRTLTDERNSLAALSDLDLLAALRLTTDRRELTRAGALLFCDTGREDIVYQYRATPGGEPRLVERPSFPLLLAYLGVLDRIAARRSAVPVTLPNGQQIELEDYPRAALREALANAFCHRDWRMSGAVAIDHSPEVLAITSPGPLVAGVTPENILTVASHPRNATLLRAARLLGLAEETGRGVDRMYREAIRAGRAIPAIEGTDDQVRVSFRAGSADLNLARFVAQLPPAEQEDTDALLVILRLCRSRTINAGQAAPYLQKSVEEAATILRRLARDDLLLLEPTRESASRAQPNFRLRGEALRALGPAVGYNRRSWDDTDRKVIAHVREYGRITNKTLQNIFDVGVYRARDILADLASREILTRISTQARGPLVVWGPGPKFPRGRRGKAEQAMSDPTASQAESPLPDGPRPPHQEGPVRRPRARSTAKPE